MRNSNIKAHHMYITFQVKKLIQEMEFVFVPFVNPDGYEVPGYHYNNLYSSNVYTIGMVI